jgi:hypothetical protein
MEEQLITFETAKLAKEKGFDVECLNFYGKEITLGEFELFQCENRCSEHKNSNNTISVSVPTQALLQKWLREEHKIEVTPMPMFRGKCNYDSFKRDGYTYEIMQINPCQFLTWSDFNTCAEDRDEEIKNEGELICLKPSVETYESALEEGLIEALKLIKI